MSAALQDSKPTTSTKPGTECTGCADKGVTTTGGMESAEAKPAEQQVQQDTDTGKENAVVVMQGPLGAVITEALNKSLNKKNLAAPVQVPNVGTESLVTEYVQANGQINNAPEMFSRISKAVGLVPCTDEKPTVVNTMLDAASKVDDIDFIVVEEVESCPSAAQVPQKSVLHFVGDQPGLEGYAVEAVQMVVRIRRIEKK